MKVSTFMRLGYMPFMLFSLMLSCGEKPEEHEEEESHSGEEIVISKENMARFGIETEVVNPAIFHDVIKTSGSIEASGSDLQTIVAKKSGIVTLTPGVNEGISIKAGQNIGSISTAGVQGGDQNQAARANLEAAKTEYERLKQLYEERLVTASTFREAERVYREAEALAGKEGSAGAANIIAGKGGTLVNLFVKNGDYVDVGQPIASVVQNSRQILKADLPAREARHLSHLESANFIPEGGELVKLETHGGKKLSEGIAGINNGYIPVYFSFEGNPMTSPGGYAEVFLLCGDREGVISLPKDALMEIQGNKYAYVADEHGFEKRLVKTGSSDGERIEIKEGLNPGERVVSKGASIVRMMEISAVAPPSHSHNH